MANARDTAHSSSDTDETLSALARLLARQAARAWVMSFDAPSDCTPQALTPDKKELRNDEQR